MNPEISHMSLCNTYYTTVESVPSPSLKGYHLYVILHLCRYSYSVTNIVYLSVSIHSCVQCFQPFKNEEFYEVGMSTNLFYGRITTASH